MLFFTRFCSERHYSSKVLVLSFDGTSGKAQISVKPRMIQRQDSQGKYPWLLCCVAFVWANIERLLVFPLPSALRFISLPAWQRLLRCRRKAEPSSSVASTMRASSRNANIHPHLGPPTPRFPSIEHVNPQGSLPVSQRRWMVSMRTIPHTSLPLV